MCAKRGSNAVRQALLALLFALALPAAHAQAPAPAPAPARHDVPRPEELEPAVDTTHAPAPSAPAEVPSAAPAPPSAPPPAPAKGSAAPAAGPSVAAPAPRAAKSAAPKGADRLQLDTTAITGNRELPKVLYIVPWKRSDLGDLAGRPVNSLLDEVLQPLDRDVFKRENRYYDALQPGQAAPKADAVQGSGNKP